MTRIRAAANIGLPTLHHDALGCSRALAAVVAAASCPAPVQPDAELLALGSELDRLEAVLTPLLTSTDPHTETAFAALDAASCQVTNRIAALRATTLAGFAVQARAIRHIYKEEFTADGLELVGGGTDCDLAWAVLSGLAWAAPANSSAEGARPIPVIDDHDAELIDLGRRWLANRQANAELNRLADALPGSDFDPDMIDAAERESWLIEAIMALPARTIAGLAVKARVLMRAQAHDGHDEATLLALATQHAREETYIEKATGSLVADLLRLAAEPAR